jgi:small GTP-binding protein
MIQFSTMIQKKICMFGASGVGKTSLVQRYVQSIYSGKYHVTIGVKIDKKAVSVADQDVNLMLWDFQGEDDEHKIRSSFLRGASGYLLVIDYTRHETFVTAFSIQKMIENELGKVPFLILLNKSDLVEGFEISDEEINEMKMQQGWEIMKTSALSGENVEAAFTELTRKMLDIV